MGILPAAKESRGVWRQRWGFCRQRRRAGAFGVSDGDFAGGEGEQGRLASAMGILPAAKENRGVWRQYAFILSCGEFGSILILVD